AGTSVIACDTDISTVCHNGRERLERSARYGYEAGSRESGGIGRRAGFRILWAKHPWGFKSPLSHSATVRSPSGSSIHAAPDRVGIWSVVPLCRAVIASGGT